MNGTPVAEYQYDANGNRTVHRFAGGNNSATYDEWDRLLTYGDTTYAYTANGELQSKTVGGATTTFSYDALGNLRAVTMPGRTIEYVIDARNRRIGRKVDGTLVQGFLYADQLRIVAELDGTNTVVSRFVYGTRAHVPDSMIRGGVTYRILTDHLGSPVLVVNTADGTIAQQIQYDEFGRILSDTNPAFQPFAFAGGLHDPDTGLVRFGARDYYPRTGRWTAKDPIGFDGGDTNLYGYVFGDPINLIDPTGLNPFCTIGGRFTPYVRTPLQIFRSQQARGMPRATPPRPYVPQTGCRRARRTGTSNTDSNSESHVHATLDAGVWSETREVGGRHRRSDRRLLGNVARAVSLTCTPATC